MREVPPGIKFIANSSRLLIPPALTFSGIEYYGLIFGLRTPQWLYILLSLASLPFTLAVSFVYACLRDRHNAALNGAFLAPSVPRKWPGGLDLLVSAVQNLRGGYIGEVYEQQCRENGNTISLNTLWERKIFTTEPEHIKAVLATQFNSFVKGPLSYDALHSLLGTGVFNSDGDIWKFHRSITRPFFNRDRISDFDIFEKHADDVLGQLKARLKAGYPVDFQDMISRFTLDSATEFLFGKNVRSLSAGLVYPPNSPLSEDVASQTHPSNVFTDAFLQAQIVTSVRARIGPSWRLLEFWGDRVEKYMQVCHKFINPILRVALEKKKSLKEAGLIPENNLNDREVLEEETLLDHLVNYTEDLNVIKDEVLNIMIAGRDTTAGTLTFAVWMLSQHPNVLRRLREEILCVVGSSQNPTLEELRDMKYLRAVINETLRLYPAVPFNARMSTVPVVLPSAKEGKPIYVPANTRVCYSVFLMHRRKDLWGPDAEEFDPDRFLDERVQKYLTPNPFIFCPFNAGPRICMGQQFAYNEMSYFLTRLLQSFSSISLAEDVQTLAPAEWAKASGRKATENVIVKSHLTAYVQDGLWVRMEEAQDA